MKIVVFAGTSEGKAVSSLLESYGHELFVTVATEYGKCVFEESLTQSGIHLLEGRLDINQMKKLMASCDLVVDATHPYAVEVSKNIVTACEEAGKSYLRILRASQDSASYEDVILWAENQQEAIELMNRHEGRVLLTTGSKDLPLYTSVQNYQERLFPRILPDMASLQIAMEQGYKKKNIICMQGPFTHEVNAGMLEMIGAELLLTKETGASGGYYEKLSACHAVGAKAIVIRRPQEEIDKTRAGKSIPMASATLEELEEFLAERKNFIIPDENRKENKNAKTQEFSAEDVKIFLQYAGRMKAEVQEIQSAIEQNEYRNPAGFMTVEVDNRKNKVKPNRDIDTSNAGKREFVGTMSDTTKERYEKSLKTANIEQVNVSDFVRDNTYESEVTVPKTDFKNPPRFPIFLDLAEKQVTVIGSGNIARRRIAALLDYGARVRVISPHASNNLQMAGLLDWEGDPAPNLRGNLEVMDRGYQAGDLDGAVIAVAATNNREVNHAIFHEAKALGIPVSVADRKEESSYFFPATWTGENLSVGIVGDGNDHCYVRKSAEKIREKFSEIDWKSLKE